MNKPKFFLFFKIQFIVLSFFYDLHKNLRSERQQQRKLRTWIFV